MVIEGSFCTAVSLPSGSHRRLPFALRTMQTARVAVRAHGLFTLIFAAGLAWRVLAEIAYRPALLYIDSVKYLAGSDDSEAPGYRLLLRRLAPIRSEEH